ncbi:MAG: TetR/AcrR family transcriptional regulator [Lactobacillus sp.]|jgi:AcrR family transcriptional regulator|nr:TetR/AcrR family transcriptional regulator [Lactobacillus sp.]MCI2033461.1 TetR/AcrR family transcriptional regulator [Lactobacillus sp.]
MVKSRPAVDPEKKARILDCAMHQFAHHGYRDTKTDAIAVDANVSKGLIFNYFGSKANLYLETVKTTYDKIINIADLSVWQDSPDLKTMVQRALRYKISLQLQYPDEFALSMQAYAEAGYLPESLRPKVQAIWTTMSAAEVPDMVSPILKRLPLREGVSADTVAKLLLVMTNLIGEQSKEMIRQNADIKIEAFDPVIAQVLDYIDILEHGFLAPNAD